MNPQVDRYLLEGCMRCPLGGTAECKVHPWNQELILLRSIVLDCGLTEELKWGVPCYTYNGKNIVIVAAFKDYTALSFFKGSLLQDAAKLLTSPGENSQYSRYFRLTSMQEIADLEADIRAYIFEAIEVEKSGAKVEVKKIEDYNVPEELQRKLDEDPFFRAAFEALTPGRQRSYFMFVEQAKQAATREARVEKSMEKVFLGKGWNEY